MIPVALVPIQKEVIIANDLKDNLFDFCENDDKYLEPIHVKSLYNSELIGSGLPNGRTSPLELPESEFQRIKRLVGCLEPRR